MLGFCSFNRDNASALLGIDTGYHSLDLAIIDKRRPQANETKVMNVIGDVKGRSCIIVDDIVDTAGTLCTAAQALKEEGADRVVCYITHPVFFWSGH